MPALIKYTSLYVNTGSVYIVMLCTHSSGLCFTLNVYYMHFSNLGNSKILTDDQEL